MDPASVTETLQIFQTLQYITAAIFILLVFDHCLTIGQEVKTIWGNSTVRLHSKAAFVINRYLTEGVTAYVVYIFSGTSTTLDTPVSLHVNRSRCNVDLSSSRCERFIWIYGVICIISGAISHFVVLIRVYALWDRRANVARLLVSVFGICISTTTILGIFSAMSMQRQLTYSPSLHTCVFGTKPKTIIAMLAVLSVFDLFLAVLVVFNAMDRPRLTHVELVSGLQTDGLGLFLILWCLRLADVIISIFKPPAEVFVAITAVWAVCSIVNARLHMRLEGLALSRAKGTVVMLEDMM
ncbi:hypothetical protein R3P38DRAFT_1708155 [Favolaschia claudopus]|uniref:DUF6533 domain-containing protein n=1 Tax=Favolaschia claudopus TaxID=2862362 RepID=A0AAW0AC68_9AGAR